MDNASREDYLREIYRLCERGADRGGGIRKTDIAEAMGVSKSGVTQMTEKLREAGLVDAEAYAGISLTAEGFAEARRLTHSYRVIEVFLHDTLGFSDPERIRAEAHRLEHGFSDAVIRRLDRFLGNPKRCPHGGVIHAR
jgi:DtxR family Mn-dependent transcriptional regulator